MLYGVTLHRRVSYFLLFMAYVFILVKIKYLLIIIHAACWEKNKLRNLITALHI